MRLPFNIRRNTFYFLASLASLLSSPTVIAAERVVVRYNIFRESISVDELTTFVETGKSSPTINYYLNQARQDPQTFRNVLTQEVNVSPVVLDRTLNNPIGEFLLDRIGKTIHTPSGQTNRQALRAAIVLSASKGNKVSLLKILQNYPTSEVYVEGDRLVETYNQISLLVDNLPNFLVNSL